jgi:hypothetical protein
MPLSKRHKELRSRNIVLAGVLFGLVALFFVITLVKFGGNG